MQVTVRVLGVELLSVALERADAAEGERVADETGTVMGFVLADPPPADVVMPDRE